MTHKDIYTKFMIEYDKANVTSSYPSLTEYEVATVLDKAYHALIAQKVTGNNVRRSTFESDIKSIADLGPLTKTSTVDLYSAPNIALNVSTCESPEDLLYFLQATITDKGESFEGYDRFGNEYKPIDGQTVRLLPVKLVNHEAALKFFASSYNIPWIKNPVCYIEGNQINVVYDSLSTPIVNTDDSNVENIKHAPLNLVYIRKPNLFVKDLNKFNIDPNKVVTYFDYDMPDNARLIDAYKFVISAFPTEGVQTFTIPSNAFLFDLYNTYSRDRIIEILLRYATECQGLNALNESDLIQKLSLLKSDGSNLILINVNETTYILQKAPIDIAEDDSVIKYKDRYTFECNDTMAEELISLAVAFALENVESQRLNSKLNMRGLEA